ncbi:hypothetical protein [Candidatus Regiella insecticola]|uniref:hypothetical protein n=1 Tax=Candidatus Regiella insecticola TaxID=138073 RepID=UPI0012FF2B10|nr:hypothetical protein [Candidatus Regiella insecticola]
MNFELRQGGNQSNSRSVQIVHDWNECEQPTPPRRNSKGEGYSSPAEFSVGRPQGGIPLCIFCHQYGWSSLI